MTLPCWQPRGKVPVLCSRCCTLAVQAISLPSTHRLNPRYKGLEPRGGAKISLRKAHTGNAWEGPPAFADVLPVLISWAGCSQRIANIRNFFAGVAVRVYVQANAVQHSLMLIEKEYYPCWTIFCVIFGSSHEKMRRSRAFCAMRSVLMFWKGLVFPSCSKVLFRVNTLVSLS